MCFCDNQVYKGWFPFGARNGKFKEFEPNLEKSKLIPNYCMKH